MIHGTKETTAGGNLRAPPMEVYLDWVLEAWESIPKSVIKNSFISCGIIKTVGGGDDDQIHVFKVNKFFLPISKRQI